MTRERLALSEDELEIDLAEELQREWGYFIAKSERVYSIYIGKDGDRWLADIVRAENGSVTVEAASIEVRHCANYKAALMFCRVLTIEAEYYDSLN